MKQPRSEGAVAFFMYVIRKWVFLIAAIKILIVFNSVTLNLRIIARLTATGATRIFNRYG